MHYDSPHRADSIHKVRLITARGVVPPSPRSRNRKLEKHITIGGKPSEPTKRAITSHLLYLSDSLSHYYIHSLRGSPESKGKCAHSAKGFHDDEISLLSFFLHLVSFIEYYKCLISACGYHLHGCRIFFPLNSIPSFLPLIKQEFNKFATFVPLKNIV